jgi:hypothetical protein
MAPKRTKAQGKSHNNDDVFVEQDGKNPPERKEGDVPTPIVEDNGPVLVVFVDGSSMIYDGGPQSADNKFNTSVKKIITGTLEKLQMYKSVNDDLQQPTDFLSFAEQMLLNDSDAKPALVRFQDGSAFSHVLGKDYMLSKLRDATDDVDIEKLEFEEGDDFKRIEQIAKGYNLCAAGRCENSDQLFSIKMGAKCFNKTSPTSTAA